MNRIFLLVPIVCAANLIAQVRFDDHFHDATMRIDYYHTGHSTQEIITLDRIYRTETWAGRPEKLIDDLNYGPYTVKIRDVATNTLIFSKGFSCIFAEYKTTAPARQGVMKTYHATVLIPFPRIPVYLTLEARDRQHIPKPIFNTKIDPSAISIIRQSGDPRDRIHTIARSGPPRECLDLVFVAEGYTEEQYDRFTADAERFTKVLLNAEPFKTYSSRINISAVFRPSVDPGVDEPDHALFRNTALDASYNALDLPRYLLINDNKALRDIAGRVPHDTIVVIANSSRYGGGGIYNDYAIFTAHHRTAETIFLHELGHSFANLADEYFSADVSYEEFFAPGVEPLEPNITALLDPENVKWKNLLFPDIPVPTPWGQEEIAKLHTEKYDWKKKLEARIARNDQNLQKIRALRDELNRKIREIDTQIAAINRENREKYAGKVGVFEGAGYSAKGLYRPGIETDFVTDLQFSPVARHAIERVLNHHTETACANTPSMDVFVMPDAE